jgi:hypothetical protein
MKVTPCIVKEGKNAGAVYYVRTRLDWGSPRYTVDARTTGWHKTARECGYFGARWSEAGYNGSVPLIAVATFVL